MGAAAAHPTDQTLQAYGLGKLDDASAESVSKHLESCPPCQSRVAEMSSDSFLSRLRGAQGRPEESSPDWAHSSVSQTDRGSPVVTAPPADDTMPAGLADHPDYEVIKELGRGGMGVVYLAHNRLMGRNEVLKVMGRHIMDRPGLLARFLSEIRAVARLQHPNIVTAYSAFRLGESIVFAMEYVEGLDLAKMVRTKGPLPVPHASYFVSQAAQGMQHAHERGMVHRDIKPGNLMLSHKANRAVVKVLDFGLAKATREAPVDGGLTNPGQALGTPDYMAPEQIRDAQKADVRADVYSLGCTLYYLLSGGPPFRAESLWDLYQAHHSMDAKLLNFVRPDVPGELAAVVAKMMAKEPGRRFQSPSEVAQALAPFFKKASSNFGPLNAEISRVGPAESMLESPVRASVPTQPLTSLAAADAPPAKKPAAPAEPETPWDSLIEFKETEVLKAPTPAVTKTVVQKSRLLWPPAAAVVLVAALIVGYAAILFKSRSGGGTIGLPNMAEDAARDIDGDRIKAAATTGESVENEGKSGERKVPEGPPALDSRPAPTAVPQTSPGESPRLTKKVVADAELIAFYGFDDGKATDASDHGNDGTFSPHPPTAVASGFEGGARRFIFSGDNAVTSPVNINPDVMPKITMGGWFRPNAAQVPATLISHDDGQFDRTLVIDRRTRFRWSCFTGRGVFPGSTVSAGQWTFIALRHDQGTGKLVLDVNGDRYRTDGVFFGSGRSRTTIGRNPTFGAGFDGLIDNIFMYRGVLSNARIDHIRARGRAAILSVADGSTPGDNGQESIAPRSNGVGQTATVGPERSNGPDSSLPGKTAKKKAADALQPGTTWSGKQIILTEGNKKTKESTATLTVLERDGETFRARYVVGDSIREIRGTIRHGQLSWSARDVTPVKGGRGLDHRGLIKGGQIALRFSGISSKSARRISGTLNLHL